jgi:fucose 4-O-acetylase-like acetyltransferase
MQAEIRRDVPLAYLRSFLTLLVVLHHAVIAYCTWVPPPAHSLDAQPLLWTAFPIVDAHRWGLADLIIGFNDTFFMSLMFLIAGTFAWPSLVRKGASRYVGDRARRLGIPFVVSALVLAPLAYYASWLANVASVHAGSFWQQWLALGVWPAGPAWFLWVLLAFGALAALGFRVAPRWGDAMGRIAQGVGTRPVVAYALLVGVSLLVYLPMAKSFDPSGWASWGPFFVQTSRVPHYFIYFVAGIGLGAAGTSSGMLQADGRLARRWPLWSLAALVAFVVVSAAAIAAITAAMHGHPNPAFETFANAMFPVSCAASSFACLALFLRFARKARAVFDSLSANAYGIYLLHYACVTWLQFALLRSDLPGAAKAGLVFAGAVAASWSASAALRRMPLVASCI